MREFSYNILSIRVVYALRFSGVQSFWTGNPDQMYVQIRRVQQAGQPEYIRRSLTAYGLHPMER